MNLSQLGVLDDRSTSRRQTAAFRSLVRSRGTKSALPAASLDQPSTTRLGSFPMKVLLGATLGALLLATPVIATAAPARHAEESVGVVSTPYTYGNGDSQAIPVFSYNEPGDPVTISTPNILGNRGSNQSPVFDYRGAAPLAVMFNKNGKIVLPDGMPALVNRTGDGR